MNPPVIIEHESHNLNDSLSRLRRILNNIDEAFKAIDQDYYMNILQSECRQRIEPQRKREIGDIRGNGKREWMGGEEPAEP